MVSEAAMQALDDEIVALIRSDKLKVPPFPTVVRRLSAALESDTWNNQSLADIVGTEQTLAATVLKLANSAAIRGCVAPDLPSAVSRIGAKSLLRIATAAILGKTLGQSGPLLELKYQVWRHALVSAELSRLLAQERGLNEGEAYLCGLLQNFGQTIVLACVEELFSKGSQIESMAAEQWLAIMDRFQFELGLVMSAKWELPPVIDAVIRAQGDANTAGEHRSAVELVAAADAVVALLDQAPVVDAEMLQQQTPLSLAEATQVAEGLPQVMEMILVFQPEKSAPSSKPSLVEKPPTQFVGTVHEVDWAVQSQGNKPQDYRAIRLNHSGLGLRGPERKENTIERFVLTTDDGPLTFCGVIALCTPLEGAGAYLEVKPMALVGTDKQRWARLVAQAG